MEKAVAELRDVSEEGPAVGGGAPADVRRLGGVPARDLPPAVAAGAIAPPKRGARAHRSLSFASGKLTLSRKLDHDF